jgi:organic hydroperoxide reductase OsmC/OhrA
MNRLYRLRIHIAHNMIVSYSILEDITDVLYTATAHATGDGCNGHARSEDGILELDLRMPKELGGRAHPAPRPAHR